MSCFTQGLLLAITIFLGMIAFNTGSSRQSPVHVIVDYPIAVVP